MALMCLLILVALMPSLARSGRVNDGIVNGNKVRPHSRPYMVSIGQMKSRWTHHCGGFLVSDRFVMTAAHCWKYGDNVTVALGAHDLYNRKKKFTPMGVKYYHIYPPYHHAKNDIMLLQLKSKVQMNSNIGYINLPTTTQDIKANSICSTAGWGRKSENTSFTSKQLMEVNVTVIDQQVCENSWRGSFSRSVMMCTGGDGGFCQGDSGGPLVCNNTAVGIVSFNDKHCEQPLKPNVYTKISHYLPWINAIIHSF